MEFFTLFKVLRFLTEREGVVHNFEKMYNVIYGRPPKLSLVGATKKQLIRARPGSSRFAHAR